MKKIYKIYKVTNLINGKLYIGQTSMSIERRWYTHINNSYCIALSSGITKYGQENFTIEWIASSWDKFYITELENYFMEFYNTKVPNGYNIKDGGFIGDFSGETIERMSKSQKKRAENLTQEEKKTLYRGLYKYIEDKKCPIIGVNFNHEIIEFPTINSAYESDFYPEASLKDQYTRCNGYIFFYKGKHTLEEMIKIVERAKVTKKERITARKLKFRETTIEKNESREDNKITAVNPLTKDVIHYRNINHAVELGVSPSSLMNSLKPTEEKINRYKGYHFFYTSKHTIDEMFKLAEERNELIHQRFLAGRKKARANNQKSIDSQKKSLIGINPDTLEYKIFESGSEAMKQGYSRGAFNLALKGMKRRTKGLHFQYYTKSIEEHIEIVKSLYSQILIIINKHQVL